MKKSKFNLYDHVIWDSDDEPEVCVLVEKVDNGFMSHDGERIIHDQLSEARLATHKEIYYFYDENMLWS